MNKQENYAVYYKIIISYKEGKNREGDSSWGMNINKMIGRDLFERNTFEQRIEDEVVGSVDIG